MNHRSTRAPRPFATLLLCAAITFGAGSVQAVKPSNGPPPVDGQVQVFFDQAESKGAPSIATTLINGPVTAPAPLGAIAGSEVEPNGTPMTATPIVGTSALIKANIPIAGDIDYYSFTAQAGDRLYAATQTSFSASASTDSVLEVYQSDGTTLIEGDEDDGTFGGLASTVANVPLAAGGTYFLRVRHSSATGQLRPYYLHFQLRSGAPVAETEPNDNAGPQLLPASGWVSGTTSSAADADNYLFDLNAGDTVFMSVDMDPERDGDSNNQLGFAVFDGFILNINDTGGGFAPYTAPDSEAYFFTVKDAGTYLARVSVPTTGSPAGLAGTYTLSVSVHPNANEGQACQTYTSTDVPVAIPDAGAATSAVSTIMVPGNPRIEDLNIAIQLNHTFMQDLDFHLISPAGNDNGFFTDVFNGSAAAGSPTNMDLVVDDEAGIPPAFAVSAGMAHQPELAYRLGWYDGENAGGTWTLQIRDDAGGDTGTLTGWSLSICEPPPPPMCAAGFVPTTVFTTDFEAGDAGFTHTGTADEWERGTPATAATGTTNPVAAFLNCASGTNCWKTDLDNTYNASSNQDLLSPAIDLTGLSPPVVVRWSHRYQMDNATNDHYNVLAQPVGVPASAITLFQYLDGLMTDSVGTGPATLIGESAGWGVVERRADAFAGQNVELQFHLDSGTGTTNFGGAAIDDVSVTACRAAAADLGITKTDGVATAVPGGSVTYTITASNLSGDSVTGATVADTFPASLTCSTTCAAAGGGTCAAGPFAGNINDTVNLPAGASVTYTSVCMIAASATGTLVNTATVSSAVMDPTPANNSATDTDTLTPQANLGITKTDGVTSVAPGSTTTYTIVASNAGPSNAPGSNVSDNFPAFCTSVTWTCAAAGGGSCGAANGAGNINQTVNLPSGGSVTYTAMCAISGAAAGTLVNTATVATGAGVTDPTPGNNSATDTDTIGAASADLSITKTDGLTNAALGANGSYTIVASNAGPNPASGTVNDTVPAGFTVSGFTCTGTGGATCPATGGASQVIAAPVTLPVGSTATFTVNGTYSQIGVVSNTASIAITAPATDPNGANNSATDMTTVGSMANVSGTKTVTANVPPDGPFPATYTIVLTNNGAGAQLDNPGNEFDDVLPQGFDYTSATATSGVVTYDPGTRTVAFNGAIPAGGSVTITINGIVNRFNVQGGQLSNQGTIRFDADGNGSNESTALTDDPNAGGAANPTVLGFPAALGIPTLDRLGLLLLILSLGLVGTAVVRRR